MPPISPPLSWRLHSDINSGPPSPLTPPRAFTRGSWLANDEVTNVTETAAPALGHHEDGTAPMGHRRQSNRQSSKQSRGRSWSSTHSDPVSQLSSRLSHGEEADLSEVVAPAPVRRELADRSWYQEHFLEDEQVEPERTPVVKDEERLEDEEGIETSQSAWSGLATQLYIFSYLILFSILGTLARLGTQWLTFYPGAPVVFPNLWANVGGSFVMGFLTEDRNLFRHEWGTKQKKSRHTSPVDEKDHEARQIEAAKNHMTVKKTIPLYIGLSVGFCGSYTSFSTFQRDVFLALANGLPTPLDHVEPGAGTASIDSTAPRNGGYSFMAVLAVIFLTLATSMAALMTGAHLALALDSSLSSIPFRLTRRFFDPFCVVLGWGCWLGAVFMVIWPPDRPSGPDSAGTWAAEQWRGEVLLALVFAPVGCILRFILSMRLNGLVKSFPMGTFTANIFGTIVLGMCYDLQHVSLTSDDIDGGHVSCQVLQGVQDGFCGCLTTVSTFMVELRTLRRRHSYTYGVTSILAGMSMLVVIMGSIRWTSGYLAAACVVGRS